MVAILNTFRELARLRQINVVLIRHGFGEFARMIGLGRKPKPAGDPALPASAGEDGKDGKEEADPEELAALEKAKEQVSSPMAVRARLVATDLGPSFIKLGQIASTRPDVIPADWIRELKKLQDDVKPLPYEEIKEAIEASLGASVESIYAELDEKPLAAASIGQVHKAVLKHEDVLEPVVVKVQRPGIRTTVAGDLDLLHHLAKLLERAIPETKLYSPVGLVEQFDRAITAELDFALEGENAERFRSNFAGVENVRFPKVFKKASTKQVLTLEFLPGKKINDAIKEDGHTGEAIAKSAIGIIVKMIFEDGFFHADPHPGNILISGSPDNPVIGMVDLGMVGRLSPEMRDRCVDLMIAIGRNDHIALADALYAIGTPTKKVDMRAYRATVATLSEKYLGKPLKEIDFAAMIGDMVMGAQKYGIEIPPDFMLVGKALMTIEGVGKEVYPDLDVFAECKPYFIELLRKRYSPERIGGDLLRGLERMGTTAYDLPQIAREVLEDVRLGRLTVATPDPQLAVSLDRLGRRILSGLIIVGFVGSGAALVTAGQLIFGGILLGFGVLVMLAHSMLDFVKRWKT